MAEATVVLGLWCLASKLAKSHLQVGRQIPRRVSFAPDLGRCQTSSLFLCFFFWRGHSLKETFMAEAMVVVGHHDCGCWLSGRPLTGLDSAVFPGENKSGQVEDLFVGNHHP